MKSFYFNLNSFYFNLNFFYFNLNSFYFNLNSFYFNLNSFYFNLRVKRCSHCWPPTTWQIRHWPYQLPDTNHDTPPHRAGEMIPEVEGTRPWGPRRKGSPSVSKGPKPPIGTTIAIAEKQSKRSKKGPFSLYLGSPLVPPRKWNLWGPEGKVPPGPPRPGFSGHADHTCTQVSQM